MSLASSVLQDWLVSIGVKESQLNTGPYIPEMPNVLTTITILPGAGYAMDGIADQPTFQVRQRSEQNDQLGAEQTALDIDAKILTASFPVTIDGTVIMHVDRLSGSPAVLGPPDNAERYDYVCTYRAVVGT